ncbi:MAG: FKBP-type peptidyl-prolyl cis-trans isomerase [Bacteroidetes bacterium]|nr:MAG: FKBP-type peptidyl-prolyl cis-trans isomerase [Bacteroidota bacterium]
MMYSSIRKYLCCLFGLSVVLLMAACSGSGESAASEAPASPPPAAAAPTSPASTLKPPYPIADSSQVQTLPGGIQLYIIEKGSGAIPKPGSHVFINYHGMLTDGTVFDSSFERGAPADFALNQLIKGWQIGLTAVPTGSKIKLIIPPEYGYGPQGSPPNIPGNATLIFDIELISTY